MSKILFCQKFYLVDSPSLIICLIQSAPMEGTKLLSSLRTGRIFLLLIITVCFIADGVTDATKTAQSLQKENVTILTVAVGGNYDLSAISSPGLDSHVLTSSTDQADLAQKIVADLGKFPPFWIWDK